MPTLSLNGVQVELSTEAFQVAQQWLEPLQTAAKNFMSAVAQFDKRVQPTLAPPKLALVFRGLIDELVVITQLFAKSSTAVPSTSAALQTTMQDFIGRYLDGFILMLGRILADWDKLGAVFFLREGDGSQPQYTLDSLAAAEPLPDALHFGGYACFVLIFDLKNAEQPASPAMEGRVVYLPRDVERDYTLIGNTRYLCTSSGAYATTRTPCGHPWCQSIAERVNAQLGEPEAIPTCIVWPAGPASSLDPVATSAAYGYREYLRVGTAADCIVSAEHTPEVRAFFRTLGRQLALAWTFCISDLVSADFPIHLLRPYCLGLAYAFDEPFADLKGTGMFDPPNGPLTPPPNYSQSPAPAAFGLAVQAKGSTPPTFIKASPYANDVKQGCAETLESLAELAEELEKRLQLGQLLFTWFRPRTAGDALERQGDLLELLSATSSWSDWKALDGLTSGWRAEDNEDWVRYWFGGLLGQLAPTIPLWTKFPQAAMDALAPLRDQVTGLAGVRTFQEIRIETILDLAPSEQQALWDALISLAQFLGGFLNGAEWESDLETDWGALPLATLAEFELANHRRARLPFFVRCLRSASLWSGETAEEVKLTNYPDATPPRLKRETFFPEPMAEVLSRRLHLLKNEGVRIRLVTTIPALMSGGSLPRLTAPLVGPMLQLTAPPITG